MPRVDDEDARRGKKRRDEEWETLKRRVQMLATLDGAVVPLENEIAVARVEKVADAAGLVAALRAKGTVDRAAFAKCVVCTRPLTAVTSALLATAHRDLRALASAPARASTREHKKALVRYGVVDEAWLRKKAERVEALSDALRGRSPPRTASPDAWFGAAVELVRALHGEASARAVAEAGVRLASLGAERRRAAAARIEALARAIESGEAPEDADLAPLVAQLERARDLPGRARRKSVHDAIVRATGWAETPKAAVASIGESDGGRDFAAALRRVGLAVVQAMPAPRDPKIRDAALECVALHGLAFPIGPEGIPIASIADVDAALAKKRELAELAGIRITAAQAHVLARLELSRGMRAKCARWVAEGLDLGLLTEALASLRGRAGLEHLTTMRSARAYITWVTKLVPHYAKLGIRFELSSELFVNLPKNEDLGVLALCLMERTADAEAGGASVPPGSQPGPRDPIATLDATLGLFKKLPRKASGVLQRLRGTAEGEGRRLFPELAAWLDDDALLDRFVHLSRIAGRPVALTKHLREDFEHETKAARERAHLERLAARSERQEARLAALLRVDRSRASAPRGRTRRRLHERIDDLLPIAYRRELDVVFREILREAWGIAVPKLTEAWRVAVRFWLVVDDNRELLGKLLRAAARSPGQDVKLEFPANWAWQKTADESFHVASWLAPRSREVVVGTRRWIVSIEEDPLEVLRMGIPFGTCLALDTGCNAAATVLNALDINKRVIYVRSLEGKVVARKLLAVTKDHRLVGYRLYCSLGGEDALAISLAVDAMCRELADDALLDLASGGEPAKIHEGFWYDDGTVGFGVDGEVERFCRKLRLEPVPKWYGSLAEQARVDAAMERDDVEGVAEGLVSYSTVPWRARAGAWLVDRLGASAVVRRAKDDARYTRALVSALAVTEEGMARALEHAPTVSQNLVGEILQTSLWCFGPSAIVARALADACVRTAKLHGIEESDFGLIVRSTMLLARTIPDVAMGLALVDTIAPAWDALAKAETYSTYPDAQGVDRTLGRMLDVWVEAPDPDAVVACLMGKRRSRYAHRIALGIAARHVLPNGERALVRFAALRPELASSPVMLAAMVRQANVDVIDAALEKRLPRPTERPFEALEDLVALEGYGDRLSHYVPDDLVKWAPGPWESAWYRRHLEHPVMAELERIAKTSPFLPSFAHERLALFGDVERIVRAEAAWRDADLDGPRPPSSQRFKQMDQAIAAAKTIAAQVAATKNGRLDASALGGTDVVDRLFVELAIDRLRKGERPGPARNAAIEAVCTLPRESPRFLPLVHELVLREADDALARVLSREQQLLQEQLLPSIAARLYARGGEVRATLPRALGPNPHLEHYAAYTWAVERAAKALGFGVEGLLEDWALYLLGTSRHDEAPATVTLDQMRSIAKRVVADATPAQAAVFYQELPDALSCSIFLRALAKVPLDRAAAIREAAQKVDFDGDEGAARKAWLEHTRLHKNKSSPIDQA